MFVALDIKHPSDNGRWSAFGNKILAIARNVTSSVMSAQNCRGWLHSTSVRDSGN
jgi:hypothetical protein